MKNDTAARSGRIFVNFFLCGLGEEDFAELPEDLIRKYTKRFWVPEAFVSMFGQMSIIRMDDGTKPE